MGEIFDSIIKDICTEKNIEQKDASYGWIKILKKDSKKRYIIGYTFELNSATSKIISKDKYATFEILKLNDIPIIEHRIIFNPSTLQMFYKPEFLDEAKKLFDNNSKVIIKANDSSCGRDVYCCENELEMDRTIKKLFDENNDSLSACPYMDIKYEYRVIYLCGDILFLYKKVKPYVIGDGTKNVKELIKEKEKYENIEIDVMNSLDLNYVPKIDEKITISWKHNLSNSAEPILIDESDKYIDEIKNIALKTGKALNISFASIDICLTNNDEILVMEVNSNVCMAKFTQKIPNGYNIVKNIYSKAIDKMFEN